MSGHEEDKVGPPSEAIIKAGHEPDQVDARPIIKFGIALTLLAVFSYLALWGLLRLFEIDRAKNEPKLGPMAAQQDRLPPEPRLQMAPGSKSELKTPDYEMVEQKKAEQDQLHSYGWANRNSGAVRIPIDEAMKLIVSRLPSQAGAATGGQSQGPGGQAQTLSGQQQQGIELPTGSSSGRLAEPRKE